MKKLIVLLLAILTACSPKAENKEIKREERVKVNNYSVPEEKKVPQEIEKDLGYAFTVLYDASCNRVNNINIACNKVSGSVLVPGEEFSFNKIVGKRSTSTGFLEAPVLISGEKETGVGGGICQVSSTIHMAAVHAGLKISERHSHSKKVNYAPYGLDAAVVYGEKDFKFINNTPENIHIYVWVADNKIFAKIVKKVLT